MTGVDTPESGGDGPRGPEDPGGPNIEWFRRGEIAESKFDPYLFNPDHPANRSKAKGWRDTFGIGPGDGPLLARLIREQLYRAYMIQTEERPLAEGPRRVFRKWELSIPEFEVPGRRSALVVSVWAQDPGEERPHLVTAIARP